MRVLGLDQATATGWAIADESAVIVKSGCVRFADKSHGRRFYNFSMWLEQLLEQEQPDVIVYELPHLRGFQASLVCVGFVAQIERIAYEHNIRCLSVRADKVKLFATGKGRWSDKKPMIEAACLVTGKLIIDDNEADAIHMARLGVQEVTGVKYEHGRYEKATAGIPGK